MTCPECGEGFTPLEWETRHSDEGADVHEHCCRTCRCPFIAAVREGREEEVRRMTADVGDEVRDVLVGWARKAAAGVPVEEFVR